MNTMRFQFWHLKNVPSADRREDIASRWDAESQTIELINKEGKVYMARINVNPQCMDALARDIADLISEAQKAGYLEAQRDMRWALGLRE